MCHHIVSDRVEHNAVSFFSSHFLSKDFVCQVFKGGGLDVAEEPCLGFLG